MPLGGDVASGIKPADKLTYLLNLLTHRTQDSLTHAIFIQELVNQLK